MSGNLIIKNGQDQEFRITHNDDVGAVTLESDKIATKTEMYAKYSGFKNYIINGNFYIWQYATSQTTAGYGSDDRWNNSNVGSTKTHSRQSCTDTERALFNAQYYSRTVVSSVAGASNYVNKLQFIEDVTKLAGKTVTLSFWARADSTKNIGFKTVQMFGTGGSPSTYNVQHNSSFTLTSTWQKFTKTLTLPSIVGKTLGTDGVHTSYTRFDFEFELGSSLTYAGIVQQSGTFDIAQVQLEEGTVATPFEQRPIGLELSLCQRYYEVCTGYIRNDYRADAAAMFGSSIVFKQTKRVPATYSKLSELYTGTSSGGVYSIASSIEAALVQAAGIVSTGGVMQQSYYLLFSASAEL